MKKILILLMGLNLSTVLAAVHIPENPTDSKTSHQQVQVPSQIKVNDAHSSTPSSDKKSDSK